jgi:hypothetical protein
MSIELTSTAFQTGETIPKQYTGDGVDQSPPLRWSEPPSGGVDLVVGPAVQDHRKINYFRPSISFILRFSLPSTGFPTVMTNEPSFATVSA